MSHFSQATINAHSFHNVMDDGPMTGQVAAYEKHLRKAQARRDALRAAEAILDTSRGLPPHCYRRVVATLNRATARL